MTRGRVGGAVRRRGRPGRRPGRTGYPGLRISARSGPSPCTTTVQRMILARLAWVAIRDLLDEVTEQSSGKLGMALAQFVC